MLVATSKRIEVWKFNPHHGAGGKFTSGRGGTGAAAAGDAQTSAMSSTASRALKSNSRYSVGKASKGTVEINDRGKPRFRVDAAKSPTGKQGFVVRSFTKTGKIRSLNEPLGTIGRLYGGVTTAVHSGISYHSAPI